MYIILNMDNLDYILPVVNENTGMTMKFTDAREAKKYADEVVGVNAIVVNIWEDHPRAHGFFPITSVSRDDLKSAGYSVNVSDGIMVELARKLADDYCNQLFWGSLDIIADILGIKKIDEENKEKEDDDENR